MKYLTRHIKLFESTIAILFLLSNSGFTLPMHTCPMERKQCCVVSGHGVTTEVKDISSKSLLQMKGTSTCCSIKVAGGLNVIIALLEQPDQASQQKVKIAPQIINPLILVTQDHVPYKISSVFTESISPIQVERYVLFVSFLI